eukprot:1360862-Ditylum_brightwellii.AAC.1
MKWMPLRTSVFEVNVCFDGSAVHKVVKKCQETTQFLLLWYIPEEDSASDNRLADDAIVDPIEWETLLHLVLIYPE